jgi:hypothetical protein
VVSDLALETVSATVPIGDEVRPQFPANVDVDHVRQDRAEMKETDVEVRVTERLVPVRVAVRARSGVEKRQSA